MKSAETNIYGESMARLINNEYLERDDTHQIMMSITRGDLAESQIAALLTALQMRGISADELLGFRDAMLETGKRVDLSPYRAIDIVGTGGDGKNTFNISTCSCFVVAGAGYHVAKHGNYAATSVSGAGNVLEQHGAKFTADNDLLLRSIEKSGVAYMHAPLFATGMKNVAPVRRIIGIPTFFNLLGPLINPSRPPYQLLGVATLQQMRLYKEVLEKLGMGFGLVNSTDGYDEISLTGTFKVQTQTLEHIFSPADLGLDTVEPSELCGGSTPAEAAAIFLSVLSGTSTKAQQQVVAVSAAFAIRIIDESKSMAECLDIAFTSINSGRALQSFKQFIEINS